MDELTKRYANALTAELTARDQAEREEMIQADMERKEKLAQWIQHPAKTPQWMIDLAAEESLKQNGMYQRISNWVFHSRYDHEKAKVRLKVIEERLLLRRARLYAQGRNDR